MFQDKIAVVTGGAKGIGKAISEEFRKAGAKVCTIDLLENDGYVGDLADQAVLEAFARKVIDEHGHVDYLINNALPLMKGIDECTYEEFNYALRVGVTAPFYLTKLFAPHFAPGAAIVNISSSRDRMSQPQTESYTAAKGGIAALTHALAMSLAGKVRVNSISPGWIDTDYTVYEGPDAVQQPAGRVGNPLDIANMVLYLCSDKAGFITGENICIDGGMTRQMIYHNDFGWTLQGQKKSIKTAICYYSRHHGNTLKVLEAMAAEGDVELIDVTARQAVRLEEYDCIGFASGIYGFEFHKGVVEFARQYLPVQKPVFFVYTYGGAKGTGAKAIADIAKEKACPVLGEFSCKGYDTFGPFKLMGGIAKGHPDAQDLENARAFYREIQNKFFQK